MNPVRRSFSFIFCAAFVILAGCADEANEVRVDQDDVCFVEDENGAIVETPCDDSADPSLQAQYLYPGGCTDDVCKDIDKK